MIGTALRDRVIAAIWPSPTGGPSVWAILDCARDDRLHDSLRDSRLDYRCLFGGRLPHDVEVVAPHLLELQPDFTFTPKLIEMGWGQSWGVFVRIDDPSNLRHHLRGLLRVRDEAGRVLLFRYYDPRVLRVYLPTCRTDELRAVFGPIGSFLVEGEDGASLIEFEFDGEELRERRIALTGSEAPC